ncbi:hypothetical protein Naga_100056g19 [Nannochloropsis gaditana]|uniref:Uncharacterized protein n=1 Tax=Nannochloropsis gaditana TaxID=72520 RepID=W7U2I9_9STRA|nr:hypothetical protein Naga_100056g19 [Nannochloropsis gaditana]
MVGGGGEQREQGPGGEGGEVGQVGGHEEAEHAGRVQEGKCDEEEAGSVLDAPTDWNQVREEQESPGGEGSGGGEGEGEDAGEVGLGESCASDLQQDPLYLQEVENQLESFWVEHMAAQQAAASGNAGGEDGGGRGQAEGSDLIYPQSSDPADYPSPYSVQGGSRHDVSAPTLSSQPSSYPESQHYGRYPPSEYALVPGDRSHHQCLWARERLYGRRRAWGVGGRQARARPTKTTVILPAATTTPAPASTTPVATTRTPRRKRSYILTVDHETLSVDHGMGRWGSESTEEGATDVVGPACAHAGIWKCVRKGYRKVRK